VRAIGGQYEYSNSAEYQIGRPRTLCAAGAGNVILLKGRGGLDAKLAPFGYKAEWREFFSGPPLSNRLLASPSAPYMSVSTLAMRWASSATSSWVRPILDRRLCSSSDRRF
jgi:hypothetical protein